jgi:DNA primase
MSRCFVIAVDETGEQTERIITYQNQKATGKIDGEKEQANHQLRPGLHQNVKTP